MLSLIQVWKPFQNFRNLCHMQKAFVSYQFRTEPRSYFYPNRQDERQRIAQSQLIIEKKQDNPKQFLDHYYTTLGLTRHATLPQIKAKYYSLAKRYHPDSGNVITPVQAKRFKEITNAYHILTDDTKRRDCELTDKVKEEKPPPRRVTKMGNSLGITPATATSEDFIKMAGGDHILKLEFLEAAHGVRKSVDLSYLKKCHVCNGKSTRRTNHGEPEPCRKCTGTGRIQNNSASYSQSSICDQCQGKRFVNRNRCDACENRGFVKEITRVVVPVPAGAKTGDIISIENPHNKERVNYRLSVVENECYKRAGNDVVTEKSISISEALLGASLQIPGVYEDLTVRVEPGTQSHSKLVLKGKGLRTRDGNGDHIVIFKITIPRQLNHKQRQLAVAWAKTEKSNLHSIFGSFDE